MTDREKVIKGLKCCLNGPMQCDKCPYKNDDGTTVPICVKTLRNEAVELLKEQEARVMTLEEVKKHNNKDNCVWFELRNIVIIPVFVSQARQETIIENRCILSDQTIPHLYWKNIDYRKKWRCWNTKPTDEQRKTVKWDEAD